MVSCSYVTCLQLFDVSARDLGAHFPLGFSPGVPTKARCPLQVCFFRRAVWQVRLVVYFQRDMYSERYVLKVDFEGY